MWHRDGHVVQLPRQSLSRLPQAVYPMTRLAAASGAIVLLFVAIAFSFARVQSVWIDETTQLSGLGLGFKEQLMWLLGQVNPVPGVPPDRMPPISYWLGSGWAALFGLNEMSMRVFGIVALACGAPAIVLSAQEMAGRGDAAKMALFALCGVLLTPTILTQAGEIRAYPVFLSLSAWAALAYVKAVRDRGGAWLFGLAVFSVLAAYTHFFGVVMAFSMWASLLMCRLSMGGRVVPVLAGGIASAVAMLGLVPFVLAALGVSSDVGDAPGLSDLLRDLARLAFRMQLHGVHLSSQLIAAAMLAATGGLMLMALHAVLLRSGSDARPIHPGFFVILPVLLGFGLQALVKLAVASFDALAPHYSIWMVPLVALFLALPLSLSPWRRLASALALVIVASNLIADVILLRHATAYTHGPGEWVSEFIENPADTVVIHDANANWGSVYFPVHYLTGGAVTQILRSPDTPDRLVLPDGLSPVEPRFVDRFGTHIHVRAASLSSMDLARRLGDPGDCGIVPMPTGDPAPKRIESRCAYESATIAVQTR
ncbi:glycosyltransferase family 39 protein [Paracoccus salsus]|uniref:glycosyltransferase family 39 protein n=1 Tax=Paracoccus salsus TaxID=2911061 RepID=UPI001F2E7E1F|nr:glycosyltransferase family 39 protein [Paracoccus salsus]MCF3973238.1 glycosyltransferase family 39 protein [Paracoccus salsus]